MGLSQPCCLAAPCGVIEHHRSLDFLSGCHLLYDSILNVTHISFCCLYYQLLIPCRWTISQPHSNCREILVCLRCTSWLPPVEILEILWVESCSFNPHFFSWPRYKITSLFLDKTFALNYFSERLYNLTIVAVERPKRDSYCLRSRQFALLPPVNSHLLYFSEEARKIGATGLEPATS
jgi:hypothetical protein